MPLFFVRMFVFVNFLAGMVLFAVDLMPFLTRQMSTIRLPIGMNLPVNVRLSVFEIGALFR